MPIPSRPVRLLSLGAALVTCSLASAGANPPLLLSTLDSASGFASLGSTTGTFSYSGPANSMNVSLSVSAGSGFGSAKAYGVAGGLPGYDIDFFSTLMATTSIYTSGIANVAFTVTLGNSATFWDAGVFGLYVANWTLGSTTLSNGDTIAAGTHQFIGNFLYSGTGITSYGIGFILGQASASAIPLPGAAGLAAVGLVGLGGRRRRR